MNDKNRIKFKEGDTTAPLNACIFKAVSVLESVDSEGKKDDNKFNILGYAGNIMEHWYWGNWAFDISTLKFAKKCTPVLESHDRLRRIGYSTKQKISDAEVTFEGRFLENSIAQEMKGDLQGGFPMEASLSVKPGVVEYVKEGESVEVNGHKLTGPGVVLHKAKIKEVSMCTFGADPSTKSLAANVSTSAKVNFETCIGDSSMDEKEKQQIIDAAKADGEKAERDIFAELKVVCAGDAELLVQCYEEGKTTEEALQMRMDKLEAANTTLKAELETAKATKPEVKAEVKVEEVDPANAEFSDNSEKFEDKVNLDGLKGEELYKAQWQSSKDLQKEFSEEGAYVAFCKADAKGRVNII